MDEIIPRSRQKNCNHCVLIKRRCDRRAPVCSRCAERNVPCVYGRVKGIRHSRDERHQSSSSHMGRGQPLINPVNDQLGEMDVEQQLPCSTASLTETIQDYLATPLDSISGEDHNNDPFMNLLDSVVTSDHQWFAPVEQVSATERPISPVDQEVIRSYEKMSTVCQGVEPWHLYDPKQPLHYIFNRLKAFTKDVATRSATPFLHPSLYKSYMPQCMLSCFSANVLYTNRTPTNAPMVMRALHTNARDLIIAEEHRTAAATPVEKLARTQALLLYQVIRLLDGDVMLRAQGEKDMALLKTWLRDLCRVRENLGDLAKLEGSVLRRQSPMSWERWIFAESMRRTIMISYSFMTLYGVMIGAEEFEDPEAAWSYAHRWTLSRHLWEARSSFEFARAWKDRPHYIISNYALRHFLECGRADDVDEFAEIVLNMYMGVDETREFMSARGVPCG